MSDPAQNLSRSVPSHVNADAVLRAARDGGGDTPRLKSEMRKRNVTFFHAAAATCAKRAADRWGEMDAGVGGSTTE